MNSHTNKRLRVVIVAALALIGGLHSSCNKYELLDGCTYRNDIGASKPVTLRIGHQKQVAFIADATYYLPEGTKIHFKALHGDTEVRINDMRFTLKHKGDEIWYITRAQQVWDRGHPNDWVDLSKDTKIQDYVTDNKKLD